MYIYIYIQIRNAEYIYIPTLAWGSNSAVGSTLDTKDGVDSFRI